MKNAFYFPHFSNARNDAKVLKLRRVLGLEGYAIYFMILEILRDQTDFRFPLDGLEELEFELRVSKEKISTVIHDYDLFVIDETHHFFSAKFNEFMQPYLLKAEKNRESALKRWKNANALPTHSETDANALPTQCERNAIKEKKGKEKKEKKTNEISPLIPPTGGLADYHSDFDSDAFKKKWNEWLNFRREIKKKMTPSTIDYQLKFLSNFSVIDAMAIIDQSIQNGWTGLFNLKNTTHGKSKINYHDEIGDIYQRGQ